MIINNIDPSTEDNYCIRRAACFGRTEIFKLLLADKRVDPSAEDNEAINWAARNGWAEIVKIFKQWYINNNNKQMPNGIGYDYK